MKQPNIVFKKKLKSLFLDILFCFEVQRIDAQKAVVFNICGLGMLITLTNFHSQPKKKTFIIAKIFSHAHDFL